MDGEKKSFAFNVGDEVIIAIDPASIEDHAYGFNDNMRMAVGEVHTITKGVKGEKYNAYRISDSPFVWDERVLEYASAIEPVDLESIGALL